MPNGTYGGVRGREITVGGKQPTLFSSYSIFSVLASYSGSAEFSGWWVQFKNIVLSFPGVTL